MAAINSFYSNSARDSSGFRSTNCPSVERKREFHSWDFFLQTSFETRSWTRWLDKVINISPVGPQVTVNCDWDVRFPLFSKDTLISSIVPAFHGDCWPQINWLRVTVAQSGYGVMEYPPEGMRQIAGRPTQQENGHESPGNLSLGRV